MFAAAVLVALIVPATSGGHDGEHPVTKLSIAVRSGDTGDADDVPTVERAKLYCDGHDFRASGFLRGRNAGKLCARAEQLVDFLTTPPDPERICTQVYGSSHHARVKGLVTSRDVNRGFHRRDGCGIGEWHRARMLLGGDPPNE